MLKVLKDLNPNINIFDIEDEKFKKYGRKIEFDLTEIKEYVNKISMPEEKTIYVSKDDFLTNHESFKYLEQNTFGEMSIQVGFCNGRNSLLNALEYHKSIEVNIAFDDVVLLVGDFFKLKSNEYSPKDIEGIYLKKYQSIELYSSTLHFAPCQTSDSGFKVLIVLPEKTNEELTGNCKDKYLFKKNKWLICNSEANHLIEKGAALGLMGERLCVNY